jgi:hypothetical protein
VWFLVECTHVRPRLGSSRWLAAVGLFASLLARPAVAHASDEDEYEMARGLVDAAQYAEAAARFGKMLDPAAAPCSKAPGPSAEGCRVSDAAVIQRARGLFAVALHALNKPNAAKDQFKQLLRQTPTFSPSPALYPPKVIVLFTEAKQEIEAELTAATIAAQKKKAAEEEARRKYEAWQESVEKLAATETVVSLRSRWIAAIPFGVGQFQNDDIGLGIFFMSLEGAAATGAIVTSAMHANFAACPMPPETGVCGWTPDATTSDDAKAEYATQLEGKLTNLKIANIVSFSVLAAAMIAGVIEAQASFEPAVTSVRPRKLPPKPPKPPPAMVSITGVPGAPDATGLGINVAF